MHGLTAGHSAMRSPPMTFSAAAVGAHSLMSSDRPMTDDAAVTAHRTSVGHDPMAGHDAMVACLAILAAAVALLVRLLGSHRPSRPRLQSALPWLDGGPPGPQHRVHALTLHQLSICRT